jgi:hypothetical protein
LNKTCCQKFLELKRLPALCPFVVDEDQPNTKHNHVNDLLEVPIGPITRVRAKMLKQALMGLFKTYGARWI